MPVVDRLFVYPIKSCAGVELTTANLDEFGIRHDRRWMIVTPAGQFITQREIPKMALVRPEISPSGLIVHAPDTEPLELVIPTNGSTVDVTVWKDRVGASRGDHRSGEWFTRVLGTACRPVYLPGSSVRPAGPEYPGRARVSFVDSLPFLIVSQEAADLVSERAGQQISVRRFRPNIVVSGGEPHGEDRWQRIKIGSVPFTLVSPCSRCVVTTIDPQTGEVGTEPLRTLATYRKRNGKVYFGQNAVHETHGTIATGDSVTLL